MVPDGNRIQRLTAGCAPRGHSASAAVPLGLKPDKPAVLLDGERAYVTPAEVCS